LKSTHLRKPDAPIATHDRLIASLWPLLTVVHAGVITHEPWHLTER